MALVFGPEEFTSMQTVTFKFSLTKIKDVSRYTAIEADNTVESVG
jgi:hypothetical protein